MSNFSRIAFLKASLTACSKTLSPTLMPPALIPPALSLLTVFFQFALSQTALAANENKASTAASIATTATESSITIEGRLFERGTKRPLANVNLFILPHKLKATTDAKGQFKFEHVPTGPFRWVINASGYLKLDRADELASENPTANPRRTLYLERERYSGFETTITAKSDKRDEFAQTLDQDRFMTAPGSQGDPVKAVQNMPGVAKVAGFSSQVIIQGSAPNDTQYLLEDQNVPLIFHFGGITSIVTPEAIDSVDYLSAGFEPEYSRAIGGLVGLHLRDPSSERVKGFVSMDIEKLSFLVEGPIDDKSSFLATGRYSYIGALIGAAFKGDSELNLTVVPAFYDFTAEYNREISSRDHFRLVTVVSHDELGFAFSQPVNEDPAIRGTFDDETFFYRVIPEWTRHIDADTTLRGSLAFGQESISVDVGSIYLNIKQTSFGQRAEWEQKQSKIWTTDVGFDGLLTAAQADFNVPTGYDAGGVGNPIASDAFIDGSTTRGDYDLGLYWRNKLHFEGSPYTHSLGLRSDYYTQTHEALIEPRLSERYEINRSLSLKAAVGYYTQAPQPQELAPTLGNPSLKAEHATHFVAGFEKDFRGDEAEGYQLNTDLFYKTMDNLVVQNASASLPYSNDGTGRAHGVEVQLKYNKKPWTAWLVYTLSRSLRTEPGVSEHLFSYDQTHNINLMAMVELEHNYKVSTRIRYVTGNPYTPIVGSFFDSDNDVYVPLRGDFYSARQNDFFQADVRVDKTWVHDTWTWSAYADIQNITNRKNIESIRYSYDYSQTTNVSDLPLLPILGVRGDF